MTLLARSGAAKPSMHLFVDYPEWLRFACNDSLESYAERDTVGFHMLSGLRFDERQFHWVPAGLRKQPHRRHLTV
jgi:hypothetical protein